MSKVFSLETVVKKLKALWSDNRSYKDRLLSSGAVFLLFCYTFLFFGPFEMVAFGGNAMSYGWKDIWWILALPALAVLIIGSLLLSLLRGKLFNYSLNILFCLTLCGYLQAAFMNGELGILNGDAIDWFDKTGVMAANLLFWIGLTVVGSFLLYLNRKLWTRVVRFACLLLVVMQVASTFSIVLTSTGGSNALDDYALSEDGMYEYAQSDNIIIFVLDRMDFDYLEPILRKDPGFFDPLTGFTGFNNATSSYARTQPALNHMLTGSETAYFCPVEDFYKDSWTEDGKDLPAALNIQGYSVEFYTKLTYLFSDLSYAQKNVANVHPTSTVNGVAVLPKLLQLSAYRYCPIALKPFFWADTNYYNENVLNPSIHTPYQFNDAGYAPGFRESTADRPQGSFKLYHFDGSHSPYTMKADGTASEESTSVTEQTMGSFHNLYAAFDRMRELGIYEDATIIITADHGSAVSDQKPLQKATRIGLFYKPAGNSQEPFAWSDAPVCTENIAATIAKAAGLPDAGNYGLALDAVTWENQPVRYYYKSIATSGSANEKTIYEYSITGDAANFDNWTIIGITEDIPDENSFY